MVFPTAQLPPNNNMAKATPNEAPLLTPNKAGSAKGLAKRVCITSPLTDSAMPAKTAVIICGKRDSMTTKRAISSPPPNNASTTSWSDKLTLPTKSDRKQSNRSKGRAIFIVKEYNRTLEQERLWLSPLTV